jgi:transposase
MPKSKPPYPAEFRKQMVDLFHAGRTVSELSREFGVSTQSISTWVAQAAADRGKPPRNKDALTSAEREELSRLRRQVRQLQQERDILAKATAWFAGRGDKTSTGSTNS